MESEIINDEILPDESTKINSELSSNITEITEINNCKNKDEPEAEQNSKIETPQVSPEKPNEELQETPEKLNEELQETPEKLNEELQEAPEKLNEEILETKAKNKVINYYNWSQSPRLICSVAEEPATELENLTRGCSWSPDGTCLLVPSADFRIRVYELPRELYSGSIPEEPLAPLTPAFKVKEGGLVYDTCWYPWMSSWEPDTCCFLSTSKETPIHLWDAFTGTMRATYRAYNQVDEVEAAVSVEFAESGSVIWSGFNNALRSFDTNRPGRQINDVFLKNDFPNARGIVSCIRDNPTMPGLIAFGTYSKCIGLYKDGPLCVLKTDSGVTQIEFSSCGTKLYSAVRRSNEFICWDLRNPGIVLNSFKNRQADTNQRIQFFINNDQIISGGTDGVARVWVLDDFADTDVDPSWSVKLSNDCVNGVSAHKTLPILATCSGQRFLDENITRDNSVKLWHCGNVKNSDQVQLNST